MYRFVISLMIVLMFATSAGATCAAGYRYQDLGNGTVLDCNTGLIWLQNAKCTDTSNSITPDINGKLNWYDANIWVAGLKNGVCNLSDGSSAGTWRLPTKNEFMDMIDFARQAGFSYPMLTNAQGSAQWTTNGDAFSNVQSNQYWTATTTTITSTNAYYVNVGSGWVTGPGKTNNLFIWPVRGVQSGKFDTLTVQ
jgi:hypothetical protein